MIREEEELLRQRESQIDTLSRFEDSMLQQLDKEQEKQLQAAVEYDDVTTAPVDTIREKYQEIYKPAPKKNLSYHSSFRKNQ